MAVSEVRRRGNATDDGSGRCCGETGGVDQKRPLREPLPSCAVLNNEATAPRRAANRLLTVRTGISVNQRRCFSVLYIEPERRKGPFPSGHILKSLASSPEKIYVRPHKETRINPSPNRTRFGGSRQPGTRPGLGSGRCGGYQDFSTFRQGRESPRHGESNFASHFRSERG
jgi:hypothetical protein